MITIEYDGEPARKARPRFNTKTGRAFTPRETKDAEERVAQYAKAQNVGEDMPLDGPVAITVSFWTTHTGERPIGRIDCDNALKLVMDALNSICWHDDFQVEQINASLFRGAESGWTSIVIRPLESNQNGDIR